MEYTILLKLQILEVATKLYNFSFIIWTHYFLYHSTDGLTRQNLIHPDFELKSIQNVEECRCLRIVWDRESLLHAVEREVETIPSHDSVHSIYWNPVLCHLTD
jgi:hypothetical protein